MISLRARLLAKAIINPETGCWEWTANRSQDGYGRIKVSGRKVKAHRVSYELTYGPIPEGLTIDHLCRVRHCINPAHLEVVTNRENILRGHAFTAVNAAKTHCPQGHEYTPENTYISPKGYRKCRACETSRLAARYQAEKASAA